MKEGAKKDGWWD